MTMEKLNSAVAELQSLYRRIKSKKREIAHYRENLAKTIAHGSDYDIATFMDSPVQKIKDALAEIQTCTLLAEQLEWILDDFN